MYDLNHLLEEHISREDRTFYAYGIGIGAGNYGSSASEAWTVVSLYTHGTVNRHRAVEVLRNLERDINSRLRLDQRPERLEFYLEDDSPSNAYRARSHRIAGTLHASDAVRQMGIGEPADGERTRPGTPRPDIEEVTKQVFNVEL
ncbi:uncharacterized protein F4812DRAFT_442814 [Daldinia caldariorum]|uniref:uncharacterized protein n=1 Tax=Daldinia caldariorum TaxID=326644 RepID=UPI0020082884|nr:uncharacterized protein F4812DRAFT_442814 [Daldinia caldariorum]KAI1464633.1 hypothetical protein F4812DRAFT_442814 [Daldinia caldariorum]